MEFKAGDRVHVRMLNGIKTDFYATLGSCDEFYFKLTDCTNTLFDNFKVYRPNTEEYGLNGYHYYTLATDENKGLRWSDGSSAEGTPIMCDEEDTEEPEVQHVNDKFSFARSKNYETQAYIQEGINLNIAKKMKEGTNMPTIKTKKEMNLPELIEWGIKNGITSKEYTCDNKDGYKSVIFDIGGKVHLNRFQTYLADDKYEVETEEQITEDTVIPKIAELNLCGYDQHEELFVNENKSIKQLLSEEETNNKAFYIMNDDLTMTLIWTKEKGMVE